MVSTLHDSFGKSSQQKVHRSTRPNIEYVQLGVRENLLSHSSSIRPITTPESADNAKGWVARVSSTQTYGKVETITQPSPDIAHSIKESEWLKELQDDWDGQGSLAPTMYAIHQSKKFLVENSTIFVHMHGHQVVAPDISIGPEGTIDIHWQLQERELLINFPSNPQDTIKYYGDDGRGSESIKGEFSVHSPSQFLFVWLARK